LDQILEDIKRLKNEKLVHDKSLRNMKEEMTSLQLANKNLLEIIKQKELSDTQKINHLIKKIDALNKQNSELTDQINHFSKAGGITDLKESEVLNKGIEKKIVKIDKERIKEKDKDKTLENEKEREKDKVVKEKEKNKDLKQKDEITSEVEKNEKIELNTLDEKNADKDVEKLNRFVKNLDLQKSKMNHYDQIFQFNDDTNECSFDLVFLDKYHSKSVNPKLSKQEITQDRKIIRLYDNGKKELIFPSGVRKEIFPDSYQIVYFTNNDIKQVILEIT